MKAVSADTFFFLAILNSTDPVHPRAAALSREWQARRVTTAWVLTEVADALARHQHRARFSELMELLRANPLVTILPASAQLFERGVKLFSERPDKDWTLTDCISFVVMEEEGIAAAFTGDHHFEQAGFNALLK
jgi:predicted nucleic acid-binding protein